MNFENRLALVTGGSSGIGLALAKMLSESGADVWILARDPARLKSAYREISAVRRTNNQRIGVISADVSDYAKTVEKLESFTASNRIPDLLINAAGVAKPGCFQDLEVADFHWMMEVNYFGTVHVTRALVPAMIKRRSGHIINISSVAGFLGVYGYSAYGPSKFAVRGFSDVLRSELREYGIRVSVVFPPDTQTPQLEYENQFKPPILQKLDEANSVMTPEAVAGSILKNAARGQYIITPGFDSSLFYHASNLLGNLTYTLMDFMVAQARRSLNAAGHNREHQYKSNPDEG